MLGHRVFEISIVYTGVGHRGTSDPLNGKEKDGGKKIER